MRRSAGRERPRGCARRPRPLRGDVFRTLGARASARAWARERRVKTAAAAAEQRAEAPAGHGAAPGAVDGAVVEAAHDPLGFVERGEAGHDALRVGQGAVEPALRELRVAKSALAARAGEIPRRE